MCVRSSAPIRRFSRLGTNYFSSRPTDRCLLTRNGRIAYDCSHAIEDGMAYDMQSVSLVKDIGAAVPTFPFIKFNASPALQTRKFEELLACVRDFMLMAGLPATASIADLKEYFQ